MAEARRILIADDHPMMRSALAQLVARALPDTEVLEAATLDQVITTVRARPSRASIDLVLLDLNMPGMNGFTGLVLIRAEFPALPVIIISASEDALTISRALDYGAAGFIPKSAPGDRLAGAILAVLAGDLWFPDHGEPGDRAADIDLAARLAALTPQQLRVFMMLAEGRLNKQIAHQLEITEATVKAHVTMILRKLGVGNRTQAVVAAARLLAEPPPRVSGPAEAPAALSGSTGSKARAARRD
jgi:DNA-binding NarL/FixJ family response regulator